MTEKEEYHYEERDRKISKEEYETYDGLCWECWDDRMTEEIDTTEGTDEESTSLQRMRSHRAMLQMHRNFGPPK